MSRADLLLASKDEPTVEADPASINGWRVMLGDLTARDLLGTKPEADQWASNFIAWRLSARAVQRREKLAERDAPLQTFAPPQPGNGVPGDNPLLVTVEPKPQDPMAQAIYEAALASGWRDADWPKPGTSINPLLERTGDA